MSAVPEGFAAARARRSGFRLSRPIVVLIVATLAIALWIGLRKPAAPAPAVKEEAQAPLELAQADVATVTPQALLRVLPLSGSLAPLNQTTLKSQVTGELLSLAVREGQAVKRGEAVARIDMRNLQAQLDSQQAAVEKARADLALAKLNRDNSRKLLDDHYISQNAYDSANSTYEASVANEKLAVAQLREAQLSLDFATVRAPFDGVVSARLAQPGMKLSPDVSILSMVDLTQLELQAPAPASEIPAVHVGQIAHFRVDGFGDRQFEGRVTRINPLTETGSRSIMLYLAVDNSDGALKGGMFAQGELALDRSEPRPSIPLVAVHSDAGVDYVYRYEEGHLTRRGVTLGLRSPQQGLVEVREGLATGDIVIVAKLDGIKDGTAATLKTAAAPAPADAPVQGASPGK